MSGAASGGVDAIGGADGVDAIGGADEVEAEALLAVYADDPRALTVAERARVEALLAGDGAIGSAAVTQLAGDRAVLATVRGLEASGPGPDWAALEARIQAATTRAPGRRRAWLVGGAIGMAALAAGLAFYLARPTAALPAPMRTGLALPAAGAAGADVAEVAPVDEVGDEAIDDGDDAIDPTDDELALDEASGDLGGMPAIDEEMVERVLAIEEVVDEVAGEADDLPAIGAAWTVVLDDLSDADLDDALRWLETQEAG